MGALGRTAPAGPARVNYESASAIALLIADVPRRTCNGLLYAVVLDLTYFMHAVYKILLYCIGSYKKSSYIIFSTKALYVTVGALV